MGRFIERYKRHHERGKDYYFNQISARAASLILGREFGESPEQFFARCPSAATGYKEVQEDREALEAITL